MLGQMRNILAPLFKAWHRNRHHVQPMVQLFPETPGRHFGFQVPVDVPGVELRRG